MSKTETYVETVACSPICENFAVCGTNDGDLHVIDVVVPKVRSSCTLNEPIVKALFSKKTEMAYVATGEGKIFGIDSRVGKVVKTFLGPRCPVLDFDISTDEKVLIAGFDDGKCLTYNL